MSIILVMVGCIMHALPHFIIDYKDKVKSVDGTMETGGHIAQ